MDNDPSKIENIQEELDKTKEVMRDNIQKTLARGERLTELEDKASKLRDHAQTFKKKSQQTAQKFCWQNWKYILIAVVTILILILILWLSLKDDK